MKTLISPSAAARPSAAALSLSALTLATWTLASCCPAKPAPPEEPGPAVASTAEPSSAPAPESPAGPKTVVVFVVDQLASWALEKYLPHLSEDGAIRRGVKEGVSATVAYSYASTRTAPGHAATMTGHPPSVTGVTSNRIYLPDGSHRSFVSDGEHAVLGREGEFAGPSSLRVPTVGDALHEATQGAAKIITISGKDRAAVISGGRRADLALWYDHQLPGFTTSTYYASEMPKPIASWLTAHPMSALLTPWTAAEPELYLKLLGPDDGPGEGDWLGFGTTFPHDPNATSAPYSVLRLMPQLTEYMMSLAATVADSSEIGQDDVVDLLVVSVSGTDYVGHSLGAMSWEFADQLIRADRAMGKLVRHLEKKGPVSVLITADHGGAPLPEKAKDKGVRLFPDGIEAAAKAIAEGELGEGNWIQQFGAPFLYLAPDLKADQRATLVKALKEGLTGVDGLHGVFDVREAAKWRNDPDPIKRSVGLSVTDDSADALYLFTSEGSLFDEDRPRGKGTTHGTPWAYDTNVPAIFWGPGVQPKRIQEVLPQNRVAPTISKLLGVAPPQGVEAEPLPGAPNKP